MAQCLYRLYAAKRGEVVGRPTTTCPGWGSNPHVLADRDF